MKTARLILTLTAMIMTAQAVMSQTQKTLSQMTSVGSYPYSLELDAQDSLPTPDIISPATMVKNYILRQLGNIDYSQVSYMALATPDRLTDGYTAPDGFWFDPQGYVCPSDGHTEQMAVEIEVESMQMKFTQRAGAYHQGQRDTLRIYATYEDKYFEIQLNIAFRDYNLQAYNALQTPLKNLERAISQKASLLPPLSARQAEVQALESQLEARAAAYADKYAAPLDTLAQETAATARDIAAISFRSFGPLIDSLYAQGVLHLYRDTIEAQMSAYKTDSLNAVTALVDTLGQRLDQAQAHIGTLNATIDAYDQTVDQLRTRLAQYDQAALQTQDSITSLHSHLDDTQASLTQDKARAQNYGPTFTQETASLEADLLALSQQADQLSVRRFDADIQQAIDTYTADTQSDSLLQLIDNYESQSLTALQADISALRLALTAVDDSLTLIEQQFDQYDTILTQLRQLLADITEQNTRVEALHQAAQVQFATVQTRYQAVSTDATPYGDQFANELSKIQGYIDKGQSQSDLQAQMFTHYDDSVRQVVEQHQVLTQGESLRQRMTLYRDDTLPWLEGMIANNSQYATWANENLDALSTEIYDAAYAQLKARDAQAEQATALADTLRANLTARYNDIALWHSDLMNAAEEYPGRYDTQLAQLRTQLDLIQAQLDSLPATRHFTQEIEAANQEGRAEQVKDSLLAAIDHYTQQTLPKLTQQIEQTATQLTPLQAQLEQIETSLNSYYDILDALTQQADDVAAKAQTLQADLLSPALSRADEVRQLLNQTDTTALSPALEATYHQLSQSLDSVSHTLQALPLSPDFNTLIETADETRTADLLSDSLRAAMLSYETDTLRAVRQQIDSQTSRLDQLQADILQLQADIYEQQFDQLYQLRDSINAVTQRQQAALGQLRQLFAQQQSNVADLQNAIQPFGQHFDTDLGRLNNTIATLAAQLQPLSTYTDYNAVISKARQAGTLQQQNDSLTQALTTYYNNDLPQRAQSITAMQTTLQGFDTLIDSIQDAINNIYVEPVGGRATVVDPMGGLRNILLQPDEVTDLTIQGTMLDDDYTYIATLTALEQLTLPRVDTSADTLRLGSLHRLLTLETTSPASILRDYTLEGCNPNLIVYAPAGATVDPTHCIAVTDLQAGIISLTDRRDLRVTKPFKALAVSYTRHFDKTTYIGQPAGWETIALPFDVEQLTTTDGRHPQPFGADDDTDTPHYWLAQIDAGGFSPATQIQANVPYIIAMPNSTQYTPEQNIQGDVTFSATDATIHTTLHPAAYQGLYILTPLYEANGQTDVYTTNDGAYLTYQPGAVFVQGLRPARPFESYVTLTDTGGARRRDYLPILPADPTATGIATLPTADSPESASPSFSERSLAPEQPVYDLTGRRIAAPAPGLYIIQGRKVLIK